MVFDILNHKLHNWSRVNGPSKFPKNFLNRYNRIFGMTQITSAKYILYTNYTYIILDLNQDLVSGQDVDII